MLSARVLRTRYPCPDADSEAQNCRQATTFSKTSPTQTIVTGFRGLQQYALRQKAPDAAGASALRMTLTLKLLGPDVPQDFSISVESSLTVTQVKECAREKWPDGVCAPANQRSTRN